MHVILVFLTSLLDISTFIFYNDKKRDLKMKRLENKLKVARAEKNLSQEELAALTGVSRQTISSIETRQYVPSAFLAFLIAEKLGKPVAELFFLEGD